MSNTYTYEEALSASTEYFGGDELASKVFVDKYALRDGHGNLLEKTPTDMHWRIAKELARVEKDKFQNPMTVEEIFPCLDHFSRIVPQGSPMYGIGNMYQYVTLSNCYVISSPMDTYGGIMMADEHLVQISKRRGGVGLSLSHIRPAGTRTSNAAGSSTGVVPFASRYSNSIREVGQNNRRGALMMTLSVHHPEVLEFASCKVDQTKVTGANISISLTNEFLNAVENDEDYEQRWPVDSTKPVISKMVSARKVWRKIIELAHQTAEPGLLFWDNIIAESPADSYPNYPTIGVNPCCLSYHHAAYVVTSNGIKEIKEVTSQDLVWVDKNQTWRKTSGYFESGEDLIYKVCFSNGEEVYINKSHKLKVLYHKRGSDYRNKIVPLSELNVGNIVACSVHDVGLQGFGELGSYEEGLILGWLSGDGCLSFHSSKDKYPSLILDFWPNEHDVAAIIGKIFKEKGYCNNVNIANVTEGIKRLRSSIYVEDFINKYKYNIWKFKEGFNEFIYKASRDFVRGYINSYFSADGTVGFSENSKNYNIQLSSIDKERIYQVKNLLSLFGIKSSIGISKKSGSSIIRGRKYDTKTLYRLSITGQTNFRKFNESIGFVCAAKQNKLNLVLSSAFENVSKAEYWTKIVSIEEWGKGLVGCIEVDKYHQFTVNGLISSNSELPLSANDSCRLLLINTYNYVVNNFKPNAYFDYERFYQDAQIAQRFMDDIVDLEVESVDRIIQKVQSDPEPDEVKSRELRLWQQIKQSCVNGRRTGTGITALGDVLAAIGIRYGTDESIEVSEKIYRTLKLGCYRASVDMAKELGPFPDWNPELEKDNPFLLRIRDDDPELYEDMQKYGRRNIALLTTAPAGTVSIETQTTSGIEPAFMLSYIRRKKINHNDTTSRVDFIDDSGDKWQEFQVYHLKFKEWMRITGETDIEKSPYYKATAEEIDWRQRVKLQAAANRHVDHAISSTLNLPEDVTVEQVAEIYETAWKAGCKGITVYRKNCRSGVLVETKAKIAKNNSVKRPKQLDCDIYHPICGGKQYFVVVGLLEGEPYEVFAGQFSLPHKTNLHEGIVTKVKQGHYCLTDRDGELIDENIAVYCDNDQEALLRMTSTALRHGSDIKFVVEQLEKVRGHMYSFAKCLCRNLKRYIPDGLPVSNGELCADCQQSSLVRSNGCITCCNCGWSKCA